MKKILLAAALMLGMQAAFAQHDSLPETDPAIVARIAEWQDLKFGFMMHWGIYAQWGVVESWSICNEPWIDRHGADYYEYKQAYQALNKTFNPTHFEPQKWAEAAKRAGMKYVVFTTKHHDGFAMFDTKYSQCPAKRDFTRGVVDAFRKEQMWIGLYFSKPDWHHPDYWAKEWATPDRNVNYDIDQHPDRWQRFVEFTHNQIRELTHNYGKVDILWLDGGWVRPEWSINDGRQLELCARRQLQERPNLDPHAVRRGGQGRQPAAQRGT